MKISTCVNDLLIFLFCTYMPHTVCLLFLRTKTLWKKAGVITLFQNVQQANQQHKYANKS